MPDVDVVICTLDHADSLDRVLHALAEQEPAPGVDWRVLVVDNGSTDATPEVVARHAAAGTLALRTVREAEPGLTAARRRGVVETGGAWVAFVDDDCLLAPDWIAQLGAAIADHPDAGAIGGQVVLAWDADPAPAHAARFGWAFAEQRHGDAPHAVDSLVGAGLVLRRAALAATGWVDRPLLLDRVGTRYVSGGDVELSLRVGARFPLVYDPRLRLLHDLSVARLAPGRLAALTRGLGHGAALAGALTWDPAAPATWPGALVRGARNPVRSLYWAARSRQRTDVRAHAAFLAGYVVGVADLVRLPADRRRALVGRARAAA